MKKILKIFLPVFMCLFCLAAPAGAAPDYSQYDFKYRNVVDDADLIKNDSSLADRLKSIGSKYKMDIVIVTVDSLGGKTPTAFADDFYDYNNYADDGILFLINITERDWAISTKGRAIKAFTDSRQSDIVSAMRSSLSNDNFESAFNIFADKCESVLNTAYGSGRYMKIAAIAVIVGLIAALIVSLILKGQLKSVKFQSNAASYIDRGSVRITQNHDIFLYKTLSKTRRETSSSSGGGGSSTHTSSSGSTHGGSSGKF